MSVSQLPVIPLYWYTFLVELNCYLIVQNEQRAESFTDAWKLHFATLYKSSTVEDKSIIYSPVSVWMHTLQAYIRRANVCNIALNKNGLRIQSEDETYIYCGIYSFHVIFFPSA